MRFGHKILFEDVTLQLNPGRHYGLAGANGSGKSTLLKILAKELSPDKGDISTPAGISIGTMRQDHFLFEDTNLIDVVLQGKPLLWNAITQREQLIEAHPVFDHQTCVKLEAIEHVIAQQQGYVAESQAGKLLVGLGLPTERHQQPMRLLSGGYKLRVLLAQLLFADCDLLLLDEPTNHLDLFTIRWLEEFLSNFKGTLVVVSHDRTFLNRVSTDILDVDHKTISNYPGNYDTFITTKNLQLLQNEKQILTQEKRRDQLMEFVDRFGAKASKARQAQSKLNLVEKLNTEISDKVLAPTSRRAPHLKLALEKASGVRVLKIDNLCKNYGSHVVLDNVSLEIERGEKVAFLGVNGIGKTTLLEIITGSIPLTSGTFEWGINAQYTYFPQDPRKALELDQTILEWACSIDRRFAEQQVRALLGKMLFEADTVYQKIDSLSGGEMARLILTKMMLLKTNVLIFDEPTNHLDMESIETLLEALKNYPGTVLLVSHNRYFVSSFAERVIEIQPTGIVDYCCTYNEYIQKREQDLLDRDKTRPATKEKTATPPPSHDEVREQRKRRTQLEREIKSLEEESSRCEKEMIALDKILSDPSFYETAPRHEQEKTLQQKKLLEQTLEAAIVKWEAACKALQQI